MTLYDYFITDGENGKLVTRGRSSELPKSGNTVDGNFLYLGIPGENYTVKNSQYDLWDSDAKVWVTNPNEAELIQEATSLEVKEAKRSKRQEIRNRRNRLEFGGFDWNGYPFDSDQISQQRLSQACQQALQAKLTNQDFTRTWTLSNGMLLENVTADQMLDICRTLADRVNSLHTRSQELYRQIDLATTKEELDQIIWE